MNLNVPMLLLVTDEDKAIARETSRVNREDTTAARDAKRAVLSSEKSKLNTP